MLKREADLSVSAAKRILFYEAIIAKVTKELDPPNELNPHSCLKVLKYVSEVRNAAQQGPEISRAKYQQRESFFIRDVNADLEWMMRVIKRRYNGKLPPAYKCCQLYYDNQRAIFKQLKRVKRHVFESKEPGKLSYKLPGKYNGLAWVIHCFDCAVSFDIETPQLQYYIATSSGL